MSDQTELFYIAPGPCGGMELSIDMTYWAKMEARIMEISIVTPTKAPELLSTFNRAALEADRLAVSFELEYQAAVRAAEKLKGEILLDKIPKYLVERGMQSARNPLGSADIREAFLAKDEELIAALERADLIKAAVRLLRGKYEAFERAFRSVKALVSEQSFNFSSPSTAGLTHGRDAAHSAPVGINQPKQNRGFGSPKYDFASAPAKSVTVDSTPDDIKY